MATRKTTIMDCDNPECLTSEEHTRNEPAQGYHFGKGFWVLGGGGPTRAFYACSEKCIAPAAKAVIAESVGGNY